MSRTSKLIATALAGAAASVLLAVPGASATQTEAAKVTGNAMTIYDWNGYRGEERNWWGEDSCLSNDGWDNRIGSLDNWGDTNAYYYQKCSWGGAKQIIWARSRADFAGNWWDNSISGIWFQK